MIDRDTTEAVERLALATRVGVKYIRDVLACNIARYDWVVEGYGCCPLIGAWAWSRNIDRMSKIVSSLYGMTSEGKREAISVHFNVTTDDVKWFHCGFDGLNSYKEAVAVGKRALAFFDAGEALRKEVWSG
jgi:hypothetical protein